MLRSTLFTFLLALAVAGQPLMASAQETPCIRVTCRATVLFKTCDRPRDGAKVVSARVLATSLECRGNSVAKNILTVHVEDSAAGDLPDVVDIDLGSCVHFVGKPGDVIQIWLFGPLRPDVREYGLACKVWAYE